MEKKPTNPLKYKHKDANLRKECIYCENMFTDNSMNGDRDYCYREKCIDIQEGLDSPANIELNSFDDE